MDILSLYDYGKVNKIDVRNGEIIKGKIEIPKKRIR
jgi:hypothetical protein